MNLVKLIVAILVLVMMVNEYDNDDFLTRQPVFLLDKLPAKVLSCKERLRNRNDLLGVTQPGA